MKVANLKSSWHKSILLFALSFKFGKLEMHDFQNTDIGLFGYWVWVILSFIFSLFIGGPIVLFYKTGCLLLKLRLTLLLLFIVVVY